MSNKGPKVKHPVCSYCGKKIDNWLPFECSYCGKIFCSKHRLPESHKCNFDLKKRKKKIEKRFKEGHKGSHSGSAAPGGLSIDEILGKGTSHKSEKTVGLIMFIAAIIIILYLLWLFA